MCALSFLSLEQAAAYLDARRVLQMLALLHEAHAVMCEGQLVDLYFETERTVDLPDYYRMIECKTAQLFDASCRLGAHAAGCDDTAIRRLRCGRPRLRHGLSNPRRRRRHLVIGG